MYKLDYDLKYTWKNRAYPRHTRLINRSCNVPKKYISIDKKGRCFHCMCDGWVPWPSGNLLDFESIEQVFNNPVAKKIQESTELNGSFKFCNTTHCKIREHSISFNNDLYYINLGIDDSCNIKCPSCREKLIFYKSGRVFEYKKLLSNHFQSLIGRFDNNLEIIIGSDGDAFASLIYRDFLYNIKENKKHQYVLKTNGLLIEKKILKLPIIHQISRLEISIDAATKKTYDLVRPPGDWNKLIKNLNFIKDNINTKLVFNFTIQKNNFNDIESFIHMCSLYNAQPSFSLLQDWGTWANFSEHSIENLNNIYYNQWQEVKQELIKKGLLVDN